MERWPKLDFAADGPSAETLHAYLQVVGKLPIRTAPWLNHGWHVALAVSPRGFRSQLLPAGEDDLEIEADCLAGELRVSSSNGRGGVCALAGQSVAEFKRQIEELLVACGSPLDAGGAPNEVDPAIPFDRDEAPRVWDPDAVRRLHAAYRSADRVFRAFRTGFAGKSSPSHLFWGSFDLAVTRFSGRPAPRHAGGIPNLPDRITREAYSHEVISAGFWPGGGGVDEAAFYAYAYPVPGGLSEARVEPDGARWDENLGEFVLTYEAVRGAADPDLALMAFLQSTYSAAADLAGWDRRSLDLPLGEVGYPRNV